MFRRHLIALIVAAVAMLPLSVTAGRCPVVSVKVPLTMTNLSPLAVASPGV